MKSVIYLALLVTNYANANQTSRGWADWRSEGMAFVTAGRYRDAAEAFRKALETPGVSGIDSTQLADLVEKLASAYAEAGQFADSEREYRRALVLVEKGEGRQSLNYALLTAGIAVLPTQHGDSEELIEFLRSAIALHRNDGTSVQLAILRICVAQVLMDQRRYAEAEPLLVDAQAGFLGLRTAKPALLSAAYNYLGVMRFNQGRYAEAIDLHRQSIELLETKLGPDHATLVVPLNNLATSCVKLGRLSEGALAYRRAIDICNKTLGADHLTCGALLGNYAFVLRKLGRKREAQTLQLQSRQIVEAAMRRSGVNSTVDVSTLRSKRK